MRAKLAITQPYVPGYRFPLWDGVIETLRGDGIDARVFFGGDEEQMETIRLRGDAVEAPWAEQVPTSAVKLSPSLPKLSFRRLPRGWAEVPLLTEMQGSNANAWSAMMRRRPYLMMGHGKEYTSDGGRLSVAVESFLNKRAAHALTYLPSGRDEVMRRTGLAPSRVTAFNNSTDTRALRDALAAVDSKAIEAFRETHGIPSDARVALFIGSLNEHKRIDVLTSAAERVLGGESKWWLVVAGAGPLSPAIDSLQQRTMRVTSLGQASPTDFAPAARLASVLVNPGRIGLIAADALTMKLPVLTSTFDRHAPEVEYLTEGSTMITAGHTVTDFAAAWMNFPGVGPGITWSAPNIESSISIIARAALDVVRTTNG